MLNSKILSVLSLLAVLIMLIGAVSAANDNNTVMDVENKYDNNLRINDTVDLKDTVNLNDTVDLKDTVNLNDTVNKHSNDTNNINNSLDETNYYKNPGTVNITPIKICTDCDNGKITCKVKIDWKCNSDKWHLESLQISDVPQSYRYSLLSLGKEGSVIMDFDCTKTYTFLKTYIDEIDRIYYEDVETINFTEYKKQIPVTYDLTITNDEKHIVREIIKGYTDKGKIDYNHDYYSGKESNYFHRYECTYKNITYSFTKHLYFTKERLTDLSCYIINKTDDGSIHIRIKTNKNFTGQLRYEVTGYYKEPMDLGYRVTTITMEGKVESGVISIKDGEASFWTNVYNYDYHIQFEGFGFKFQIDTNDKYNGWCSIYSEIW